MPQMNKTLLKRLLFELVEDLVRVEHQIETIDLTVQPSIKPYLSALQTQLEGTKADLFSQRNSLLALFDESPTEDNLADTLLQDVFPAIRKRTEALANAIDPLSQNTLAPEVELFMGNLHLNKLLPEAPTLVVLPSNGEAAPIPSSEDLIVEPLNIRSLETPLHWVGLLQQFSKFFCNKTLQLYALLEDMHLPEPKINYVAPLISLRLLGPAYYSYYVIQAILKDDGDALWGVEPVLFQGLNRFGIVNKDLVILHQAVERLRQQPHFTAPEETVQIFGKDDIKDELLRLVEKVIPERLAFTEKSFSRVSALQERLANGVLISAIPSLDNQAEQLREHLNQLDEEATIYPLLNQLGEAAATPREIINAGWMFKLDNAFHWLYSALITEQPIGWAVLKQNILELDINLLKSIETSEVHRVLSHQEAEQHMLVER